MAVPDWVRIWFLAIPAASRAKSASRMVERLASVFCRLDCKLETANSNRFCKAPMLPRSSLTFSIAESSALMARCESASSLTWLSLIPSPLAVASLMLRVIRFSVTLPLPVPFGS